MHWNDGRQIERAIDGHAIYHYGLTVLADSTVTPGGTRQIDDYRAASHAGHGLFSNQQRSGSAGNLSGGDDAIGLFGMFGNQITTALHDFFRNLAGIASGVFGLQSSQIDFEEFCA